MALRAVQRAMTDPAAPRGVDDEQQWIERARAGDEDAFRMLMERHRDHALGLALRITRSREDAEDVVQQAFVRAWFALDRFRGESSFGTWLHRIVARRALDRASHMHARRAREEDFESVALTVEANDPRDVILIRRLEQLMQQLTAAQRAVVTLYYWQETPVEEIARVLSIPENTVKTHLSRARAALRKAWMKQ